MSRSETRQHTAEKQKVSRRGFLKTSTIMAVGAAAVYGGVSVPLLRKKRLLLRPPGALEEDLFLASCIKCGQCLQVCPPQVIRLADIWDGFGIGTPYITPREGGCILCSGLPCVLACPTGALDHHLSLGKDAEMGLAVVSSPTTCLAVKGINDLVFRLQRLQKQGSEGQDPSELRDVVTDLVARLTVSERTEWQKHFGLADSSEQTLAQVPDRIGWKDLPWLSEFVSRSKQAGRSCRVCLETCPIKEEQPIIFEAREEGGTSGSYVPVVQKTCVGCGFCEQKCPTDTASITIVPRLKWSEQTTEKNDRSA